MRESGQGIEAIIVNQGALVEALIQLSNFRQYPLAEALLAACTREQLEQLLKIADRAFSTRLVYSLEKQARRSNEPGYRPRGRLLAELVMIFNAWCAEGHRSAIRAVLGELRYEYLVNLAQWTELDREVYSMLREFDRRDETRGAGGGSYYGPR